MGLKGTLKKGLAIAKKFVEAFEDEPATYTPTSSAGKVLQRLTERVAALTPLTAPSMGFVQTTGFIGVDIAFEGYFRKFLFEVANQSQGTFARNSKDTPFSLDITLEVGYPAFPVVEVAGVNYSVPDLKVEDARLIDALMMGGDLFTNPTDLGLSVTVKMLGGFYDIGNTKRRARYVLEVVEVY